MKSTSAGCDKIARLKQELDTADAVVIGAGSGLSTSAGFLYTGERFQRYFGDFIAKYGFRDMYSGGFYPFDSLEEHWAYWSRYIYINRYLDAPKPVYQELLKLVQGKDYFVLTTNVDHCFQKAGFDKRRLFYTQGDYGLWQCSKPCHQKTYDNETIVKKMVAEQKDRKIPSELIPLCPVCGAPMSMNLRADDVCGVPAGPRGTAYPLSGTGGWRQYAGHYQISVLAHDPGQSSGCLCLYQPGSGILPAGNRIPVSLHREGYWRSPDRAFVKDVPPAAGTIFLATNETGPIEYSLSICNLL